MATRAICPIGHWICLEVEGHAMEISLLTSLKTSNQQNPVKRQLVIHNGNNTFQLSLINCFLNKANMNIKWCAAILSSPHGTGTGSRADQTHWNRQVIAAGSPFISTIMRAPPVLIVTLHIQHTCQQCSCCKEIESSFSKSQGYNSYVNQNLHHMMKIWNLHQLENHFSCHMF